MAINGYRSLQVTRMQDNAKPVKEVASNTQEQRASKRNNTQDFQTERSAKKPLHSNTR